MSLFTDDDFSFDWNETPIDNNNSNKKSYGSSSSPSSSSSIDLKVQLNQLQEKLNLNQLNPIRQPPNKELEIHLPPRSNNDQSVEFLGDLSDSLLFESRKLNYENKQFNKKIENLNNENDLLKKELDNLNLLNNQLSLKEDEQNDKIWKLESEYENIEKNLKIQENNVFNLNSKNNDLSKIIENLKNSIDLLKNENLNLLDSNNLKINKLNNQLNEFKESNKYLNDENDVLHKNILTLNSELENLKSIQNNNNNQNLLDFNNDTSFTDFDDSIVYDPLPQSLNLDEIKNLDSNTLQSNLKLSYRQLSKLKSQNIKMKKELLKLKHSSPISKNKILNFNANDELDNINDNDNDNSWANYIDDSFTKKSIKSNVPEMILQSDNEMSDDDILDGSSPINSRKASIHHQKESFIMLIPKTTLDSNSEKINLNSIDFEKFQTIPIPNDLVNNLISESKNSENNEFINDNHLKLINGLEYNNLLNEFNELKSNYENPSIDYIHSKSSLNNLISIDSTKYHSILARVETLQEKINQSNITLSSLTETIDSLKFEKKNLEDKIRNPDIPYLAEKASILNHSFIPESEYIELQSNFTIAEAKLKDKEESYISLNIIKEELQANIINLEDEILKLKSSSDDLQSKFINLQKSHDSPDTSYIKSKCSSLNFIPIPIFDYNQLKDDNSFNLNKVKELTSQIKILEQNNNDLLNQLNEKDLIINKFNSDLNDLKQLYDELLLKFESPDVQYIKSKSSLYNLKAIPIKEYDSLSEEINNKSIEIENLSKVKEELNLKHVEIEGLLESKNKLNIQIENLTDNIKNRESQLNELQSQITSPSIDYIKEKSGIHNFTLVLNDDYESLKEQLTNTSNALIEKERELETVHQIKVDLERQAEIQGMKTVSLELHENVQNDLNETKKELELQKQQVNKLKDVEIDLKQKEIELSKLIEKVSDLEIKAVKLDEVEFELNNLKDAEIELNEKRKELEISKSLQSEMQYKLDNLLKKEKELEDTLKIIESKNSQYSELKSSYDSPDLSYLQEKSKSLGYIPISLGQHILNNENLSKLEMSTNKTKELENQIVALSSKNNELSEINNELKENISELTKLKESPNIDYIKEKSVHLGLVPIPVVEHNGLNQRLDNLTVKLDALKSKCKIIENEKIQLNEKIQHLENLQATPSIDYIESKSASLGVIPIPIIKYTSLNSELQRKDLLLKETKCQIAELESLRLENIEHKKELTATKSKLDDLSKNHENPDIDYIHSKSALLGLIPLPVSEHDSLKSTLSNKEELLKQNEDKFVSLNKAIEENEAKLADLDTLKAEVIEKKQQLSNTISKLDEISKLYDSPPLDYLKEKLNTFNYMAISEDEFKDVETKKLNASTLVNSLKEKLTSAEAQLDEKDQDLVKLRSQLEDSKKLYEDQIIRLKEDSILDDNKLTQIANDKGFAVVSLSNLEKNMDMQKSSSVATVTPDIVNELCNQPVDVIIPIIEDKGYKVLKNVEYEQLKEKADNLDLEDVADITHEMESIESDIESKKHILEDLENKSRSSTISSKSSVNSSVVSVENILTQKANALNDKISDIEAILVELIEKKTNLNKQVNRLSVASADFSNFTLSKKLNDKITKVNNEIEVKQIELKSQQNALIAVKAYLDRSKEMDIPPVHTVTADIENQNVMKLEAEIEKLQNQYDEKKLSLESIRKDIAKNSEPALLEEKLNLLGYKVISPTDETLLLKDIIFHGSKISVHSLIASNKYDPITGTCNIDGLIEDNSSNISSIDKSNNQNNKILTIEDLRVDDMKERMKELGYVVLTDQEMNLLVAKSNEPKLPECFTVEELQSYANKLDMTLLSSTDISKLKKRSVTSRELANKAAELKLILLSHDEVELLKKNKPITKENIVEKGKEFNLLCIPSSQFVATTVSRTPDVQNVTVLPNSYYKVLTKSHELYKKHKAAIHQKELSKSQDISQQTISEHDSFQMDDLQSQAVHPDGTHLPGKNIDVMSLHTVGTVISNKKEIMAAITQTIIGETLYKYYRKLGPFTSISDTRHARFFWVHPYSMTLYWSIVNPVMGNSSKYPIKALPILSIEAVSDNNPLPPGLYYKSIIIKSYEKSIKITCPTRQIHNIWFNSLRYLLDRTSDSWVNDDDIENQYEQDFSLDEKIEIERSQSQNFRKSYAKRTPSMMSFRVPPGTPKSGSMRSMSGFR